MIWAFFTWVHLSFFIFDWPLFIKDFSKESMSEPHSGIVKSSTLVMFTPLTKNEYTSDVDVDNLDDDSSLVSKSFVPSAATFQTDGHFSFEDVDSRPTSFTYTLTKSYLPNGMKMLNQYIKKHVLGMGSFGTTVLVEESKSKTRYVSNDFLFFMIFFYL